MRTPPLRHGAVYALLAFVTLWPAGQMWLVARYDVSPWKLAGWGMYSAPRPQLLGMEIFGSSGGGSEDQLRDPTPELRQAANDFLERWRWLGQLAQPTELVALVRARHPEWQRIKVVAYKPTLSRTSSRIEMRATPYIFDAPDPTNPHAVE